MDEMRIRTEFTKKMISRILQKILHKKTGCNPEINIHDIELVHAPEGKDIWRVHLDVDVTMTNGDLKALLHDKGFM